ncbi:hypothetical protein BJ138DRAFT_1140020 [Hygrophoropsis aurantiaca]|uniref:Uncharacterized protein n=1 Tax=Hygrophoropsis aurantiaca TaxID=72124 RepID=A0ACB8ASJ6_9AGAM|nr:hypothetical protein BJ138DRAFT_1140020 [Hygrophoropsis aurantiaca]
MLFGLRVTCLLVAIAAHAIARPCTDEPPPPSTSSCTETLPYNKGANWAFKSWLDTKCLSDSHDYFSSYLADPPANATNPLAIGHSNCQPLRNTPKNLGSFILQSKTPKWVRFYSDVHCTPQKAFLCMLFHHFVFFGETLILVVHVQLLPRAWATGRDLLAHLRYSIKSSPLCGSRLSRGCDL